MVMEGARVATATGSGMVAGAAMLAMVFSRTSGVEMVAVLVLLVVVVVVVVMVVVVVVVVTASSEIVMAVVVLEVSTGVVMIMVVTASSGMVMVGDEKKEGVVRSTGAAELVSSVGSKATASGTAVLGYTAGA
jgi:hypothetical protein